MKTTQVITRELDICVPTGRTLLVFVRLVKLLDLSVGAEPGGMS